MQNNNKHLNSVVVDDKVILININQKYRDDMSEGEILEAVRSAWLVGPHRDSAEYALATFQGEVVGVFIIDRWYPTDKEEKRWAFNGKVASNDIQNKYIGGSIAHYIRRGAQNPIHYINC